MKHRSWPVAAAVLIALGGCGGGGSSDSSGNSSSSGGSTSTATSGSCGSGTAAKLFSSGTSTETAGSYTSTTTDQSAVCLTGTSTQLTLTRPTVVTSGGSSSLDSSSFYGLNAALLAYNGGTMTVSQGSVSTTGSGANGIFSYGSSTVAVSGTTVSASGQGGHAFMAVGGGKMTITDATATTTGASSSVIATDRGGGTITVSGGRYTASGMRSAAIYSTGTISATGGSFTTTGAEVVVIEGSNKVSLTNAALSATSSQSEHRGVFLFQSFSGDATNSDCGTGACFTMTGGSYTYSDTSSGSSTITDNCAAFAVANQTAHVSLTDTTLTNSCPTLLLSAKNPNWPYAGGTATLTLAGVQASGDVVVDASSTAALVLKAGSAAAKLTGAVNSANTAKSVSLTLDATSSWVVTGTSYLTSLSNAVAGNTNIRCATSGCKVYVNGAAISLN